MPENNKNRYTAKEKNRAPIIIAVICVSFISILLVILYTYIPKLQSESEKILYPIEFEEFVNEYSSKYNLEKSLVFAIIKTESSFDSDAVSAVGAKGLMQLTDETFEWMNYIYDDGQYSDSSVLFDPETNIMFGCRVLRTLIDYFDSTDMTVILSAYNAGIGYAETWLEEYPDGNGGINYIPFDETRSYVEKVTDAKEKYTEIYDF